MSQSESSTGYMPAILSSVNRRASRILLGTASMSDKFVPDHAELQKLIAVFRSSGHVIVFAAGVWDLYHIGHGRYLAQAKEEARRLYPEADKIVLVVGVDTDELTRSRKGPKRPIVPEDERYEVLTQLAVVDIVTPQYEANTLFRVVGHDVRIISATTGDLPKDASVMKEMCEHLVQLEPQAETSTTARIRRLFIEGGTNVLDKFRQKVAELLAEIEVQVQGGGDV